MSLFRKIGFFTTLLILIFTIWFAIVWHHFVYIPMCGIKQITTIKVPPGTGARRLAYHLFRRGYIKHPEIFILLSRLTGDASLLKTGEYQVTRNMTARELLDNIVLGKVKQRTITFIEGWTFRQIKNTLETNPYIIHTINTLSDEQIMSKLGDKRHPEGMFFPDTYFFTWGETDFEILCQAYNRMQTVLKKIWASRSKNLPYKNPYQVLIVASLIEKETALSKERPEIAGVILRRLKKRMPLQVDPTILYGLGRSYDSPLTKEDLLSHTPYNTYQHYGLPPTPIDMPSRESILAAINPSPGRTLYYVSRGDGSHVFSITYQAHREEVKKYQKRGLIETLSTLGVKYGK